MNKQTVKLTKIQGRALDYIGHMVNSGRGAPTLREICNFMGYRAVGSAQDIVRSLRRKGFLTSSGKGFARDLILTDLAKEHLKLEVRDEGPNSVLVPCLGKVPAGHPLEALEDRIGSIKFTFVGNKTWDLHQLFAVQAEGESMIKAGILDGDWLVVRSQSEADTGDIVIARMDGDATVKRLAKDAEGWYLQAENDAFMPIRPDSDQGFEVIGKVVGLQRTLI